MHKFSAGADIAVLFKKQINPTTSTSINPYNYLLLILVPKVMMMQIEPVDES